MEPLSSLKFHWPILGHSQIKEYLQSSIVNNKLAHAYLFYGLKNSGKLLLATYFTTTILCQATGVKKPCNKCTTCKQIEKNIHADVSIIKKEQDKKNISIKQIREIQHLLSLKSFLTEYKITIIDDAETLTEEAANALLKTLEEPHPKTVFILISESKDGLPSTIVSRCQAFQFNPIPTYQIENWLITSGKDKKEAKIIAHFADGRPGYANILSANKLILEDRQERINKLLSIINGNLNDKLLAIGSLTNKKATDDLNNKIRNNLDDWLYLFRDVLLVKSGYQDIVNLALKNKIIDLTKKYSYNEIIKILKQIIKSKKLLQQSVNQRLILENLVLII